MTEPKQTFFMCGRGKKKDKETKWKCVACGKYFTTSEDFLLHRAGKCGKKND